MRWIARDEPGELLVLRAGPRRRWLFVACIGPVFAWLGRESIAMDAFASNFGGASFSLAVILALAMGWPFFAVRAAFEHSDLVVIHARRDVHVRRGLRRWTLPREAIRRAAVAYEPFTRPDGSSVSRLTVSLELDAPDDDTRAIAGGWARVFEGEWGDRDDAAKAEVVLALGRLGLESDAPDDSTAPRGYRELAVRRAHGSP